jgi:hypothetical protein
MLQIIITMIIILAAATVALIRFISFFTSPLEKCGGCSQNCGGCSLKDLNKEIDMKKLQKGNLKF